jgi:hypothetical protein
VVIGLAAAAGKGIQESARRMIVLVLAGAALPVLAVGWLAWGGAWTQAYDLLVRYNVSFYRLNGQSNFWPRLLIGFYFLAALLPPLIAQVVWWLRRRDRLDRVAVTCAAWSIASLASIIYQQRIFLHYLVLVGPALVVIGAPAFMRLWGRPRHPKASLRRIAIVAQGATVSLFLTTLVLGAQWPGTYAITTVKRTDEVAMTSWIRSNTPVSATLFVWGDRPEVYLDSDRDVACRYIYMDPMTTQGYWSPQATDELLALWQSSPPAAVVETPATVPLFRPVELPTDDPRTYDALDPLRTFVRGNYHLAYSNDETDVWLKD